MDDGKTDAADNGNKGQNQNRKPEMETTAPASKKQRTVQQNGDF